MQIVTPRAEAAARSREIQVHGRTYVIDEYVGSAPKRGHYVEGNEANDDGRPQAFLVHQPANAITPAHFHEPNQFQVFVGGSGRMGAAPARPLTVQYANGHTPYGPIVASDDGVKYFTLRQHWDPGAKYLPASKHLLRKGNQRTRIKGNIDVLDEAQRKALREASSRTIFEPETDGLAAWIWHVPPGAKVTMPAPGEGGGQYLLVAGGSMLSGDGATLDHLSTVFVTPDEQAFTAEAGADGLELLVLQYPRTGEALSGGPSRA
ncbi:MAG: hypothetical protein ACK5JT_06930 [Hyphomicrobiaceae bacterium]